LLLCLLMLRLRRVLAALRQLRRNPVFGFVVFYSLVFLPVYAGATTNFGTLTRYRVMLIPFLLILCCSALERRGWRFESDRFDYNRVRTALENPGADGS